MNRDDLYCSAHALVTLLGDLIFLFACDTLPTPLVGNPVVINPYNAEIFLYKPWRPNGFINLNSSKMSQ